MSPQLVRSRRYRVRIAERGAVEVEGSVEFTLYVPDMGAVPVVAGSLVHPLDGATELRPLHVLGIDKDGWLIQAFTDVGRWAAIGRLLDIQWQDADEDPVSGEWVTHGTGRCSGLDELDGPGRFRIEVADESWVTRRHRIFDVAGTTAIWPEGFATWDEQFIINFSTFIPEGGVGMWKGMMKGAHANGVRGSFSPNLSRIVLTGNITIMPNGSRVSSKTVEWVKRDMKPADEIVTFGVTGDAKGSFGHLRLRYPDEYGAPQDWEIVTFGATAAGIDDLLASLAEPEFVSVGIFTAARIAMWILTPSGMVPAATGRGYLVAPTAPPDPVVPLHIAMSGVPDPDYLWSVPPESFGFMHIADLTRRMWDILGVRYDESSLYELEQDASLPAIAPRLTGVPPDPEVWAQRSIWGPNMLLALKDAQGRRKLKDLRPPASEEALGDLPILTAANSEEHRWRLVGREQLNSILWQYESLRDYDASGLLSMDWMFEPGELPEYAEQDSLDGFYVEQREQGPYDGDTVTSAGLRQRAFDSSAMLNENAVPMFSQIGFANLSGIGQPFVGEVVDAHTERLLTLYQDGPMRGTCTIGGSLAEELEEGDYVIVDCASVKIANAGPAARTGYVLVLLLSLPRHPAHAEAEYMVMRPVPVFFCPTPTQPHTWLVSPMGELATIRLTLGALTEPNGEFGLEIVARKNASGGEAVDMGVVLYEGDTEVAAWITYDVGAVFTSYLFMLDESEQASITDWTALAVEIARAGDVGGDPRRLEVQRVRAA